VSMQACGSTQLQNRLWWWCPRDRASVSQLRAFWAVIKYVLESLCST
jgi:hypothetical protein